MNCRHLFTSLALGCATAAATAAPVKLDQSKPDGSEFRTAKAHANYLFRTEFEAAKDGEVEVLAAPGAAVTFKVKAGQSGTIEVGARQREAERGEIGAWLNGRPHGEIRQFGKAAPAAKGGKGNPEGARFTADAGASKTTFDLGRDFTAYVKFRTTGNGSLFSKAKPGAQWIRGGKVLYIRGGQLTYDIGWLGEIRGGAKVADGKWHEVAVVSAAGGAKIYLDGALVAEKKSFSTPDPADSVFQIGACATDFGGDFDGEIANTRFWNRALDDGEAKLAASGKIDETNTPDFNWSPAAEPGDATGPALVGGFVARPITVRCAAGSVTFANPSVEPLAEADHKRIVGAWDHNSLDRGARIYNGLCITCHGTDKVEGTLPTALRFHEGEFKNGKDPLSMYNTLTKGFNLMVPQPWMTPQQKWDVIHYLREAFVKEANPSQYTEVDDAYLASLPRGLGLGPEATVKFGEGEPKWKKMDYGPVQFWTIQAGRDNIAYKGIAVRLDEGPGGVAQGNKWLLYDHDTMRVAAAWQGEGYIDWKGIAFDQSHGSHASLVGEKAFENPVGPGAADPKTGSFEDPRAPGRDGKPYGPLPRGWAHYKGLFMHGNRPILKYTVGDVELLEMPGYEMMGGTTVFTRTIQVGEGGTRPVLRVAPEGTAVVAVGGPLETADGFVVARPQPGTSIKLLVAKADQGALEAHAKTAGGAIDLRPLLAGGPKRWPEILTTEGKTGEDDGPFAVDEITLPLENPWNSWMRLGGFDFFPDGKRAAVATWLGDVFIVDGIGGNFSQHKWQRIATGLFQPLGVRVVDGAIYVSCRDQIARLHDLNGDGETDYIESFNNDHQVTEHFHEFAMGLQTDEEGNFYYAKSARHAKAAVVPHHGTLLKVSKDGLKTEIIANGFRAANGVCLNPDGTFIVTDQEGHWNPKNRINYVKKGGFYGNMYGYHDVTDESDEAMDQPLCWITNGFDRSPGELMWVPEDAGWGPLNGSLLNLSYGMGRIFLVPHEKVDGQAQGGMISLGMDFPTGIMRGRFHPGNGQLYVVGMFAWAGNKRADGAFYRIRYTGQNPHLPGGLKATADGVALKFTGALDKESAANPGAWTIQVWDLKRTRGYGSRHFNERKLSVSKVDVIGDGTVVRLHIPELKPTWGMSIKYKVRTSEGEDLQGEIHNTIHKMP